MQQYSAPMDPYARSRYEQGVDSKIVICGSSGVGKSSLLTRYTQNKFEPQNTTSTSGAFFVTKKVYVNGLRVRLQLWDTAGQERFRSMAPMYYRGANAALLLYDITNASSFDDIRGWLEELKKNCPPDSLIIYIVGAKADLSSYRQVTPDFARLSLHNWFPPPRPPTPPPPPQISTLSYIRPRFTSFPGLRSPPPLSPLTSPTPDTPAYLDLQANGRSSGLSRSNTGSSRPQLSTAGSSRTTVSSTARQQSRFGSHFGMKVGGWNELPDSASNSLNEDDEGGQEDPDDEYQWGLSKGMELFEVSAKDDIGIQNLFDHLITSIIARKDHIEKENAQKKRDSVYLSPVAAPTWDAQAAEEEAREKAERERAARGWSCCST
ncbi:hypothetical protein MKEN_00053600 [Mycena kentingensis (nom. inval.)]|nr:hypothetical protein MKEN_00053600 [Mycena kentingensis (nom. inval.)]